MVTYRKSGKKREENVETSRRHRGRLSALSMCMLVKLSLAEVEREIVAEGEEIRESVGCVQQLVLKKLCLAEDLFLQGFLLGEDLFLRLAEAVLHVLCNDVCGLLARLQLSLWISHILIVGLDFQNPIGSPSVADLNGLSVAVQVCTFADDNSVVVGSFTVCDPRP